MSEEAEYDVVLDTLQKAIDLRKKINEKNESWGVMDNIRCDQIDELKKAINLWKNRSWQRPPINGDEIRETFNTIGFSPVEYRLRCFVEGIRFAEKYHGINHVE